jgi:hypothetical protein
MTPPGRRPNAGAAVAGLFSQPSATGGLAGRERPAAIAPASERQRGGVEPRVRLGVELTEPQIAFLRGLSRPIKTGSPRTLGAKFVAAGVLAAAIELLQHGAIDMHGVAAGDLSEMTARARHALLRAGESHPSTEETS